MSIEQAGAKIRAWIHANANLGKQETRLENAIILARDAYRQAARACIEDLRLNSGEAYIIENMVIIVEDMDPEAGPMGPRIKAYPIVSDRQIKIRHRTPTFDL